MLSTESDFREYVLAYTNAPTIVGEEFEDAGADGLFSGYDAETGGYDPSSWQYEGAFVAAAAGQRDQEGNIARAAPARAGRGSEARAGKPKLDPTLQHPRCVWQILKRHYAPYTPEMVERVCGVPQDAVRARSASCSSQNSGRERTTAFVHGVGWTQHTIGSQYIRAASILQLLLGNMGRPGRRRDGDARPRLDPGLERHPDAVRHAAGLHPDAARPRARGPRGVHRRPTSPRRGFWGNMRDYIVSLLKAWWGDAATAENDYCFDYLPRLTGSHCDLRHGDGADRRAPSRATSCSARTRRSARPTRACSGSGCPSSTGWSCATSR